MRKQKFKVGDRVRSNRQIGVNPPIPAGEMGAVIGHSALCPMVVFDNPDYACPDPGRRQGEWHLVDYAFDLVEQPAGPKFSSGDRVIFRGDGDTNHFVSPEYVGQSATLDYKDDDDGDWWAQFENGDCWWLPESMIEKIGPEPEPQKAPSDFVAGDFVLHGFGFEGLKDLVDAIAVLPGDFRIEWTISGSTK